MRTTQLTLVACYGRKPEPLHGLIGDFQARLSGHLGNAFVPYEEPQVHATIVGLESVPGAANTNANFLRLRQQARTMDVTGLLQSIRSSALLPFQIQIGGFSDIDYPFTSRMTRPYKRGFTLQGDKGVMMGWPVCAPSSGSAGLSTYPATLDQLRRSAQQFGILHSYHAVESDVDNDFFFRLGTYDPAAFSREDLSELEDALRHLLSQRPPTVVTIGVSDLHLAAYVDNRLPLESTRTAPIGDAQSVRRLLETFA